LVLLSQKELSGRFHGHSGAIVNAKARRGLFVWQLNPESRNCQEEMQANVEIPRCAIAHLRFKACGLAPE